MTRLFYCTLTHSKVMSGHFLAQTQQEATDMIFEKWLPVVDTEGSDEIITHVEPFVEEPTTIAPEFLAQEMVDMFEDILSAAYEQSDYADDNNTRLAMAGKLIALVLSGNGAADLVRTARLMLDGAIEKWDEDDAQTC